MKSKMSLSVFVVAILLAGVAAVAGLGFLKNKPGNVKKETSAVLGETSQSKVEPTSVMSSVDTFVQTTFQNTKEVVQQKAGEIQKTVMATVEKEVTSLTQSQVDALKQQICRDWGVITPSPSKNP